MNLDSMNGQTKKMLKMRPGKITAGRKTSRGRVWPQPTHSQLGMIRRAPSSQPMYQSGCTA